MCEVAQLQTDLLASMIGLIVLCGVISATISAGIWLLAKQRERRAEEISEEWFDELNVHLEIGDCRPDCGCDKPCGECE